jgi:hypothetical protein
MHELGAPWEAVTSLFKKSTGIYGIRRFVAIFIITLNWAPIYGQINPAQILPPYVLRSIIILASHLRLGLPIGLHRSGFPIRNLCALLFPHIHVLHWPPNLPWFDSCYNIWQKFTDYEAPTYCSFLHSCYVISLRSKLFYSTACHC